MKFLSLTLIFAIAASAADQKNILVYKEAGRFGGWPANHGIWSWGNEIVVGFSAAYFKHMPLDRHQYDNSKPEEPRLARSLDGGGTWSIEAPKSLLPPEQGGSAASDLADPMDFSNPNFAMTIRFLDKDKGASLLFYSTDRCKTWHGAYTFPTFGLLGVAARTDYVIEGKHQALVILTASKTNGKKVDCSAPRTTDGGVHWKQVRGLETSPKGSALCLRPSCFPTATCSPRPRTHGPNETNWIDLYRSHDHAATWTMEPKPVASTGAHAGNPPSMIRLRDGRICLTYGFRSEPFGIRGRLSKDDGKTWGDEISLRSDGAWWDLGYVRSVQRPDGKVVTVYYFNDQKSTERFIEATIWEPR